MNIANPLKCKCQPIAEVGSLGAQITQFELDFSSEINDFSLSEVNIFIKSENTNFEYLPLTFSHFEAINKQQFRLFVTQDVHCQRTKLLKFNDPELTQIFCKLEFNIEFQNYIFEILPIRILGAEQFEQKQYQDISYSLYQPNKINKLHPLIICLHGAGEGGYNQTNLLADKLALCFWQNRDFFNQPYILAPQCPSYWLDEFHYKNKIYYGERDYSEDLFQLIQQVKSSYPIDKKRIYIVGASMGGYQALQLIARAPQDFSAGLIACPAKIPDNTLLDQLNNTALWFVHSHLDQVVPVQNTKHIVNYLKQNQRVNVNYYSDVEIEGQAIDPHCTFLYFYDNQPSSQGISVFQWLKSQGENHDNQ